MRHSFLIGIAAAAAALALGGCSAVGGGKTVHSSPNAPVAIGPYSQMVQSGNMYFLSGVIALNKEGNAMLGTTIEEQTKLVLDYIGELLRSQGMSYSNVVMSNVYMKDLNEFAKMNAVYGQYFKEAPPSRATVEVARLPRDARVEIAVIATK